MSHPGFTLIELVIVIVVIAILATISTIAYRGISIQAKNAAITTSISNMIKQFSLSETESSEYPLANYIRGNLNGSLAPGVSGLGNNYRGMTTHIVNINDLREIVETKTLQESNIGRLSYTNAFGALNASQDSSDDGYFNEYSYNSNKTDYRVTPYINNASGLEAKITAYDQYQKEVLGLENIPSVYKSSNVFTSTAATGASRNVPKERTYPFIEVATYCHRTTTECFTSIGYYLYGKETSCPGLGLGTEKTSGTLSNSYGSGASTNHNMTFCQTYLGNNKPSDFPS